jgi:hypothetical protein
MTLNRFFDEIEGSDFALAVNVASGMKLAAKAARRNPLAEQVRAALPERCGAETILMRLLEVARRAVDPRLENPYDAALLLYLLLLEEMSPELARVASTEVLLLPNTWWSGRMAARIAAGRAHNDAGTADSPRMVANTAVADSTAFFRATTMMEGMATLRSSFRGVGSGAASSELHLPGKRVTRVTSRAVHSGARAA